MASQCVGAGLEEDTYRVDICGSFNHLHFCDIVCPSGVSQKFCNLTTKIEDLVEQGGVDRQSVVVSFVGLSTGLRISREFELVIPELHG